MPAKTMPGPHVFLMHINHHGWPDAILLRNGVVEAVIVPQIGRVMQFRFAGSQDGPFWENPALAGRKTEPAATEWMNFGGDKAWPAPQANWPQITSRAWPPPKGFDALPMEAESDDTAVTLVSSVDPDFGLRVRRRIELQPDQPVMTITTRYEKVSGPPVEVGVWVITQLKDPVSLQAIFAETPPRRATDVRQLNESPAACRLDDGRLILERDPGRSHKIGVLAGALIWIGKEEMLRIDSPFVAGGKYPDGGSSAEIYTNADPLAYIELEMLGPLEMLAVGNNLERQSTYTLMRRPAGSAVLR